MWYAENVEDQALPARVGVSGKMRSGKDTVAGLLEAHGFLRLGFADRMKELATELFGMPPTEKNRALLVALGRKMISLDERVWVNYVLKRMPADRRIVIPDLRFEWEVQALREAGFYLIRMEVTKEVQLTRLERKGQLDHAELMDDISETALDNRDDWDFVIDGSVSYAELKNQVDAIAAHLLVGEL